MTLLTSTALTDGARKKAEESTGIDPGPFVYRLHRDTCDRVRNDDSPREIDSRVDEYAEQIQNAKACTRCKPNTAAELIEKANAVLAVRAGTNTEEVVPMGPVEVYAGPTAQYNEAGEVLGLRPAIYPEVKEQTVDGETTMLWCPGCEELHPSTNFGFVVRRGTGDGKRVTCRKHQTARLEENKARKARGEDTLPSPVLPPERIAPKA